MNTAKVLRAVWWRFCKTWGMLLPAPPMLAKMCCEVALHGGFKNRTHGCEVSFCGGVWFEFLVRFAIRKYMLRGCLSRGQIIQKSVREELRGFCK